MKFKLGGFTGIIRVKSFEMPVVVYNPKRDQILMSSFEFVICQIMRKVICPEFYQGDLLPFPLGYQISTKAKIR